MRQGVIRVCISALAWNANPSGKSIAAARQVRASRRVSAWTKVSFAMPQIHGPLQVIDQGVARL
jgi:hypothetical protein